MSDRYLELNVTALETVSPELAHTLRTVDLTGLQGEIVDTKTHAPSIRIAPSTGGKPELLHSAYDPIREAQRWAESIGIQSPINAIVLGAGLGYHLLTLLRRYHQILRHIIVIEKDPRILRLALSMMDLRPLIQREGSYFFAGVAPKELPDRIREVRHDMIVHNCKILPHGPSLRCFPEYYKQMHEVLIQTITYDEVNMRTNMENQGRNHFNLYMNLPAMSKGRALKDCEGLFEGYPAIVSGAGPSLDKNIRLLHEVNDRAPVFIVDTAQNTFRKHGIRYDFVATGDPTELNYSHFEAIDSMGDAYLAFHPETQRRIVQKYTNHPYLLPLFDPSTPLLDFLFDLETVYGTMKRAMNVGHLAVNLALHMGCSPIILVGFDFAFPRTGGTTHASDAAVSRQMTAMRRDGTIDVGGKEGKAIAESGKMELVPGYYGDEVPTTVPFQLYIRDLEKTIEEHGIPFIDATEGGAYFQGSQREPLQTAMERFLSKEGVGALLGEFRNKRPEPPTTRIVEKLTEGRELLVKSLEKCDILLSTLEQWKAVLRQGPLELKDAHKRWNEFESVWREMCGDPLFDALLGGSVQHVYFRRQRTSRARDDSGNAFLELVCEKYAALVPEMQTIINSFIQCIDLSIQNVNANRP